MSTRCTDPVRIDIPVRQHRQKSPEKVAFVILVLMDTWFLYACATILCSGFGSFLQKVSAKHNHNSKVVTIFSFVVTLFVAPFVYGMRRVRR
tara:strand:+ start:1524 stop:1799 length:276 start_codon:yes stop_codon:yes gene_type:complete